MISDLTAKQQALTRLQASQICETNRIKTESPYCHLQVIRSDLLHPDITDLSAWVTVVTTLASVCALETQLSNAEVRRMEIWRNIISLSKHLRCEVVVPNSSAAPDRLSGGGEGLA